jgi:hypothetical protein
MSEESENFRAGECNGCSKGPGDSGPNEDCPAHGRVSACVGCERYSEGIAQLTEEFAAELARKESQLTEAWLALERAGLL